MRIFNIDSPFMQKLAHLFDLILLNVAVLLFSLPVFTAGAAITALYETLTRMKEQKGNLLPTYLMAFRKNFRTATLAFLPLLVCGGILSYNAAFLMLNNAEETVLLLLPLIIGAAVWGMILSWLFPLMAKFENFWFRAIVNAFLCALRFLPQTIAMTVLNFTPLLLFCFRWELFLRLGALWIFLWFSLAADLNLLLLEKPFQRLIFISGKQ